MLPHITCASIRFRPCQDPVGKTKHTKARAREQTSDNIWADGLLLGSLLPQLSPRFPLIIPWLFRNYPVVIPWFTPKHSPIIGQIIPNQSMNATRGQPRQQTARHPRADRPPHQNGHPPPRPASIPQRTPPTRTPSENTTEPHRTALSTQTQKYKSRPSKEQIAPSEQQNDPHQSIAHHQEQEPNHIYQTHRQTIGSRTPTRAQATAADHQTPRPPPEHKHRPPHQSHKPINDHWPHFYSQYKTTRGQPRQQGKPPEHA